MHATFAITHDPPVGTLVAAGELDIVSRGRLAWRLIDLGALDSAIVRLDLADVTYVDAGSLRLIDQARERLEARGTTFEISAASPCFRLVCPLADFTALAAAAAAAERSTTVASGSLRTSA